MGLQADAEVATLSAGMKRRVLLAKAVVGKALSFRYGERPVANDFSAMIMRGDRVGLIGPNGSGKTTLVHLLLGDLQPQSGTIRHGTNLEIAYFDQLHAQLDDAKSVRENVGGSDMVTIPGKDYLPSCDEVMKLRANAK